MAVPPAGLVKEAWVRAVGATEDRGCRRLAVRFPEDDSAGTVAEEDAGRAVFEIENRSSSFLLR